MNKKRSDDRVYSEMTGEFFGNERNQTAIFHLPVDSGQRPRGEALKALKSLSAAPVKWSLFLRKSDEHIAQAAFEKICLNTRLQRADRLSLPPRGDRPLVLYADLHGLNRVSRHFLRQACEMLALFDEGLKLPATVRGR
jgi:hypothetical protein